MAAGEEQEVYRLELFSKICLWEREARSVLANDELAANLAAVIEEAAIPYHVLRSIGRLIIKVAKEFPANALVHRPTLLRYIVSGKIKSEDQLEAAFRFLKALGSENLNIHEFQRAFGFGVVVHKDDIERTVDEVFKNRKSVILEQRYRVSRDELSGDVLKKHPWADLEIVKDVIKDKLPNLLGARTAADDDKFVFNRTLLKFERVSNLV